MLQAFTRNKSRSYKRYLGVRDPFERRVNAEDEITSLIFGPLEFLSAHDNWALWRSLLQNPGASNPPLPSSFFSNFFPTSCAFAFWPRKDNIEPDLVIQFADDMGKTRSLLIELKWDAGVSGLDQLEKQWLSYQASEHDRSLHIFIAKRAREMMPDLAPWSCREADGSKAVRFRPMSWHEFKHEIAKIPSTASTSSVLRRWAVLVSGFLGQLEIRPFLGFQAAVRLANAIPHDEDRYVLFWRHNADHIQPNIKRG